MGAQRLQSRVIRVAARTARDEAVRLRLQADRLPPQLRGTMRELELLAEADEAAQRAVVLDREADALAASADLHDRTDVITSG